MSLPFAVFDEFGVAADDRVQDYIESELGRMGGRAEGIPSEAQKAAQDDAYVQGRIEGERLASRAAEIEPTDEWLDIAYERLCASCKGAGEVPPTLPTFVRGLIGMFAPTMGAALAAAPVAQPPTGSGLGDEEEMFTNPMFDDKFKLDYSRGAIKFRNDVIANLRRRLAAPVAQGELPFGWLIRGGGLSIEPSDPWLFNLGPDEPYCAWTHQEKMPVYASPVADVLPAARLTDEQIEEVFTRLRYDAGYATHRELAEALIALEGPEVPEPLKCQNCGQTIAQHDRLLHCHSVESTGTPLPLDSASGAASRDAE